MARTSVTTVEPSYAGVVATPTAPIIDGDIIDTGDVRLFVSCGATPTTVTIQTPAKTESLDIAEAGGTVAANTSRVFGPFPARLFAQASDATVGANRVLVDYSSVATVTRVVLG